MRVVSSLRTSMIGEDGYYLENEEVIPPKGRKPLEEPINVSLKPLFIKTLTYSRTSETESIYPPSSRGWFSQLRKGGSDALFIVQRILNGTKLWLSVIHPVSGSVIRKHFIQPFEVWTLLLDPIETHRAGWIASVLPNNPDSMAFSLMRELERSLTWNQITYLSNGVLNPAFQKMSTAWEDLEQLLPSKLEGEFRCELKAFLLWTLKVLDLQIDPIEFFFNLTPLRFFKSLLEVHYRFLLAGSVAPSYLNVIQSASDVKSEIALSETLHESTFANLLYEIMAQSPDMRRVAIEHCSKLNKEGAITLTFPVTNEQASKSRTKWMERFALFTSGLHLRMHVRPQTFGLKHVLYFGNAYRWVHPHLVWSVSLSTEDIYPLHLQVMMLPPSVIPTVKRFLPQIIEVEWSARIFNPHLFLVGENEWEQTHEPILTSLHEKKELPSLQKYGKQKQRCSHKLSFEEARILDFIAARLNLAYLETERGWEHWGVDQKYATEFLNRMRGHNAIQVFYEFKETKLPSPIFVILEANQGDIQLLIRAFLDNSPSAVVYVGKDWTSALVVASLSEPSRHILHRRLPVIGDESGIKIGCFIPESFQNYSHDPFQRLLKPDGTWLDDVSGLLAQGRSIPKHWDMESTIKMDYESHLFSKRGEIY